MALLSTLLVAAALSAECQEYSPEMVMIQVERALDGGEWASALESVDQVFINLECAHTWYTPERLAGFLHAGARVALDHGHEDSASRWLGDACRLAPGVPVALDLGMTTRMLRERTCEEVAARPAGRVVALGPVRLDGLELTGGTDRVVQAGWHIVQSVDPAGQVRTIRVDVGDASPTLVGVPVEAPPEIRPHLRRDLLLAGGLLLGSGAGLALSGLAWLPPDCDDATAAVCDDGSSAWYEAGYRRTLSMSAQVGAGGVVGGIGIGLIVSGALLPRAPRAPAEPARAEQVSNP